MKAVDILATVASAMFAALVLLEISVLPWFVGASLAVAAAYVFLYALLGANELDGGPRDRISHDEDRRR